MRVEAPTEGVVVGDGVGAKEAAGEGASESQQSVGVAADCSAAAVSMDGAGWPPNAGVPCSCGTGT